MLPTMSTRDDFLKKMLSLVRRKKVVTTLYVDDCLPYLSNAYEQMAIHNQETKNIPIREILDDLNLKSETEQYVCNDEAKLSRDICQLLNQTGIPADCLTEYFSGLDQLITKGVVLKLYR